MNVLSWWPTMRDNIAIDRARDATLERIADALEDRVQPLTIVLPAELTSGETISVMLAILREQDRIRRRREDGRDPA